MNIRFLVVVVVLVVVTAISETTSQVNVSGEGYGRAGHRPAVKPPASAPVYLGPSELDLIPAASASKSGDARKLNMPPIGSNTTPLNEVRESDIVLSCKMLPNKADIEDYSWELRLYRLDGGFQAITFSFLAYRRVPVLRRMYRLKYSTFELTIVKANVPAIDAFCRHRGYDLNQKIVMTITAAYRITLRMPGEAPPKRETEPPTAAPPTLNPEAVTLKDDAMLPQTTTAPFEIPAALLETTSYEVAEFTDAVVTVVGEIDLAQLRTDKLLSRFDWTVTVYFKDAEKTAETYTFGYFDLRKNATLRNIFEIEKSTFTLHIKNVKERAYAVQCGRTIRSKGKDLREVLVSYHITTREVRVTANVWPVDGDFLTVGQPWCMIIQFADIVFDSLVLAKSGTTEYQYAQGGAESGPRIETASVTNHNRSSLRVNFDEMQKDDIAVWTVVVDNGQESKSYELDMKTKDVLEPEAKVSAVFLTDYQDNSVLLHKPWKAILTLGGVSFFSVNAFLNGSLVYSSSADGVEGGPRADVVKVEYNSTSGLVTISFDSFEEGDAGAWTFDYGLGKPAELNLRGITVLVGEVEFSASTNFDGKFARDESWSVVVSFPDLTDFGCVQLVRYRKLVYAITANGTEGGERCSTARGTRVNDSTVFIKFDRFISQDETSWAVVVMKKDGTRWGLNTMDLTIAPLMHLPNNTALFGGPIYHFRDNSMTASSIFNEYLMPEKGRLNLCGESKENCSWSAREAKSGEYIEVDLSQTFQIVRVATQGRGDDDKAKEWVTKFNLAYSFNGADFTVDDNNGQNYTGNSDGNTVVYNTMRTPFLARYIRLIVVEFHNHPSLRWELYSSLEDFVPPSLPPLDAPELPPRFTMVPPAPDSLVRSRSCGGGAFLHPPRESKYAPQCRALCEQMFQSCTDLCNSWHDPDDRRECEMRCSGDACTCGRQCMFKRPNHRQRPGGRPRLPSVGMGIRSSGTGDMDAGMGGVDGMGSMRSTDIRHVPDIDTYIVAEYGPQRINSTIELP